MIRKIQQFIENKNLFSKDNNLLLAISGGADSVCLFIVLYELGYKIELAHCNFNLRGKDSDKEERFVKDLSNKYGVRYHVKSFETKKYANTENVSIQMAARDLRYKWFDELLAKSGVGSGPPCTFRETADVICKIAFKMFLNVLSCFQIAYST